MKCLEIGGYFEYDAFCLREYYPKFLALNSGRHALLYLLKARGIKKIYLPFLICESIYDICKKNDYKYEFYNIDENFTPIFDKNLNKSEYLFVINYYGLLSSRTLKQLKKKYKNIIIDNTQAFYQKPINKTDTIYSCRKYFGVTDGAYLYTDSNLDEDLEKDVSHMRLEYLFGRFENDASSYYKDFKKNSEKLKEDSLKYMSRLTQAFLGRIPYKYIKKQREKNYLYLHQNLKFSNKLKLNKIKGPFVYPLYLNDGLKIKEELAKKNIYIATYWPNVLSETNCKTELEYCKNIIPVPCDQRYGKKEMDIILEELAKYL